MEVGRAAADHGSQRLSSPGLAYRNSRDDRLPAVVRNWRSATSNRIEDCKSLAYPDTATVGKRFDVTEPKPLHNR
jgi:hypothetical protein